MTLSENLDGVPSKELEPTSEVMAEDKVLLEEVPLEGSEEEASFEDPDEAPLEAPEEASFEGPEEDATAKASAMASAMVPAMGSAKVISYSEASLEIV